MKQNMTSTTRSITRAAIITLLLPVLLLAVLFATRSMVSIYAINHFLVDKGLYISEMKGFSLGWKEVQIDTLIITSILNENQQIINGLNVQIPGGLSQPAVITIKQVSATDPDLPETQSDSVTTLSGLIQQLSAVPVREMTIDQFHWQDGPQDIRIFWLAEKDTQQLTIEHSPYRLELLLDYTDTEALSASMTLSEHKKNIARLSGELSIPQTVQVSSAHLPLSLKGQMQLQPLLQAAYQYNLFDTGNSVITRQQMSGNSTFHLTALLPDQIETLLKNRFSITILPETGFQLKVPTESKLAYPVPGTEISVEAKEAVNITLAPHQQIQIDGPRIELSAHNAQHSFDLMTSFETIACKFINQITCNMAFSVHIDSPDFSFSNINLNQVNANITGHINFENNTLHISALPGEFLTAEALALVPPQSSPLSLQKMLLKATDSLQLSYDITTQNITAQAASVVFQTSQAQFSEHSASLQFDITDLKVLHNGDLQTQLSLLTTIKQPRTGKHQLPGATIDSHVQLQNAHMQLDGKISTDKNITIGKFSAQHALQAESGTGSLIVDHPQFTQEQPLSSFFSYWPVAFDIQSGSLNATTRFHWEKNQNNYVVTGKLEQQTRDLSGFYENAAFINLQSQLSIRIDENNRVFSRQPAHLSIDTLDLGIPFEDISLTFSVDSLTQSLTVGKFKAGIFKGTVSTDEFTYYLNQHEHAIDISLHALDVEHILSLAEFEGITCTGKISGHLPAIITGNSFELKSGKVYAESPGGIFRYTLNNTPGKPLSLGENIQTQLVNQILSNYHFNSLEAWVDYSLDNDLLDLKIRMQGQNPDIDGGIAANFNPNIQTSVLPVMKAHLANRSVTELLEQQFNGKE